MERGGSPGPGAVSKARAGPQRDRLVEGPSPAGSVPETEKPPGEGGGRGLTPT